METLTESGVHVLYDLGLTRLQVDAFLALLKLGTSTPTEIARACSIHRVEGYRVMKELSKLGLVEQRLSNKKSTFSAVNPKSTLSNLISIKAEELGRLRERTAQCIPVLESLRRSGTSEPETGKEARIRLIFGERKTSEVMARMWRPARQEILIMLPKALAHHFLDNPVHQRKLEAVSKSNQVKVKIITELDQDNLKSVRSLSKNFEVRCCDQVFTQMTIVDSSQIILGGYPSAKGDILSSACLWTDSVSFVYLMKRFFEGLWKDSFSVGQKVASMETGQSPEEI